MPVTEDTIVALASAPGAARRGIVRISGGNTLQLLLKCFQSYAERDFKSARVPWRYPGEMQYILDEAVDRGARTDRFADSIEFRLDFFGLDGVLGET